MILELQVTGISARAQDLVSSPFSSCLSTFLGERFFLLLLFLLVLVVLLLLLVLLLLVFRSCELQEFLFCSLLVVNALVVFVTAFVIAFLPSQQVICKIV